MFRKEFVSNRGQRAVCPPTNPRGVQSERRVLSAGDTKGTSVVSHGSATKMPPAARGAAPLTPGCRGTLGLSCNAVPARTWLRKTNSARCPIFFRAPLSSGDSPFGKPQAIHVAALDTLPTTGR